MDCFTHSDPRKDLASNSNDRIDVINNNDVIKMCASMHQPYTSYQGRRRTTRRVIALYSNGNSLNGH